MEYEPNVEFMEGTVYPAGTIITIAQQCKRQNPISLEDTKVVELIQNLYTKGHHTVFEFTNATLRVSNISRALMAQLRTHRHLSFMCSSQHFQDYRNYNIVCESPAVAQISKDIVDDYANLISDGEEVHEARMCLPNSMEVKMYISGNARAWATMLRLRLCKVNIPEMQIFAHEALDRLIGWFPQLFSMVSCSKYDWYERCCHEEYCNQEEEC